MSPRDNIAIITFGCRLNAFESDVIRGLAGDAGLRDTIIVNTCAVTAEAERQARQAIRRARREQPHARIIVTGCAATLDPARYAALAEVDLVLDNDAKLRLESYFQDSALNPPTSPQPSPPPGTERELPPRRHFPSPPFRGEREGPIAQRWEPTLLRLRERSEPARICRYSRAATIAAPFASSPMRADRAARCRSARWSRRRARCWLPGIARSC
jgi:hypothetical protein